jgi:hypothetical protein
MSPPRSTARNHSRFTGRGESDPGGSPCETCSLLRSWPLTSPSAPAQRPFRRCSTISSATQFATRSGSRPRPPGQPSRRSSRSKDDGSRSRAATRGDGSARPGGRHLRPLPRRHGAGGGADRPSAGRLFHGCNDVGHEQTLDLTHTPSASPPASVTLSATIVPHFVPFLCGVGSQGGTSSKTSTGERTVASATTR